PKAGARGAACLSPGGSRSGFRLEGRDDKKMGGLTPDGALAPAVRCGRPGSTLKTSFLPLRSFNPLTKDERIEKAISQAYGEVYPQGLRSKFPISGVSDLAVMEIQISYAAETYKIDPTLANFKALKKELFVPNSD